MNTTRANVYREMLAELKTERKNIDWQISWLENKLGSLKETYTEPLLFDAEDLKRSDVKIDLTKPRRRNPGVVKKRPSGGMTDLVEIILEDAGTPLHAKVILAELHQRGRTTTTIKSLTGSMPQDARKRFENLGRNTWALARWPDDVKEEARITGRQRNTALVYN